MNVSQSLQLPLPNLRKNASDKLVTHITNRVTKTRTSLLGISMVMLLSRILVILFEVSFFCSLQLENEKIFYTYYLMRWQTDRFVKILFFSGKAVVTLIWSLFQSKRNKQLVNINNKRTFETYSGNMFLLKLSNIICVTNYLSYI